MKKHSDNFLETTSLSAIEHLLEHKPEQIKSLRVSDRPSGRLATVWALAREAGITPVTDRGLGEGESALALLVPYVFEEFKTVLSTLADKKRALIIALDHVQDPQNFGALCRSAEALGAAALFLPKDRSVSVTGSVYAASAGAVATLPVCQVTNLNEALRQSKDAGFWIVGSTLAEDATGLEKMPDFEKMVLVMGAEGAGMSSHTEKLCDWKLQIPLRGSVQSLNVSAAGAILMHELMKRVSAN